MKVKALAAIFAALPVLAFGISVGATAAGQIEGGDIYRVRNVTKSSDFADTASATCGQTVQFKVRIHNPGPSRLETVKVVATLPSDKATSFTSRVTVSSPNADPNSASDTATVTSDKTAQLSYVSGSTELLDAHNGKLSTLGDTITTSGVTLPSGVGVSIEEKRYVQFEAKLNCETTPPKECKPGIPEGDKRCETTPPKECKPGVPVGDKRCETTPPKECKPGIPMGDKRCETTPPKKEECKPGVPMGDKKCKEEVLSTTTTNTTPPTELPHTGAGNIAFIVAGAAAVAGLAHRAVSFRRQSR